MIPGERAGYLRDISRTVRDYKEWAETQIKIADQLYQLVGARAILCAREGEGKPEELWPLFEEITAAEILDRACLDCHRRQSEDPSEQELTPSARAAARAR